MNKKETEVQPLELDQYVEPSFDAALNSADDELVTNICDSHCK
jgi:hypothetical protein